MASTFQPRYNWDNLKFDKPFEHLNRFYLTNLLEAAFPEGYPTISLRDIITTFNSVMPSNISIELMEQMINDVITKYVGFFTKEFLDLFNEDEDNTAFVLADSSTHKSYLIVDSIFMERCKSLLFSHPSDIDCKNIQHNLGMTKSQRTLGIIEAPNFPNLGETQDSPNFPDIRDYNKYDNILDECKTSITNLVFMTRIFRTDMVETVQSFYRDAFLKRGWEVKDGCDWVALPTPYPEFHTKYITFVPSLCLNLGQFSLKRRVLSTDW